jgi:hypothetical protein
LVGLSAPTAASGGKWYEIIRILALSGMFITGVRNGFRNGD